MNEVFLEFAECYSSGGGTVNSRRSQRTTRKPLISMAMAMDRAPPCLNLAASPKTINGIPMIS